MTPRVRNRLLPGVTLLDEPAGWAPSVPADLDEAAPPVDAAGTAACEACGTRLPLASLDITTRGYRCAACVSNELRRAPAPAGDLEHVKIGRGRWWLMPLVIAVGAGVTLVEPGAVLVVVGLVALALLVWVLRRGF